MCVTRYALGCSAKQLFLSYFILVILGVPKMALQNSETTFIDQTSPHHPQKDTLGTQIGPRKVIFGHFIDFEYFGSDFSCFYIVKEIKTSNGHT